MTGLILLLTICPVIRLSVASDVHEEEHPSHHQNVFGDDGGGAPEEEEIQLTGAEICALTGYFVLPHPCNCQLFYTWFQGLFTENVCETGLFFDSITLTCTLPEETTCADGFGPPPPPMTPWDEAPQDVGQDEPEQCEYRN